MSTKVKSVMDVIRDYAIECHRKANQLYDGYLPYEFHVRMTVGVAYEFKHLVPEEKFDLAVAGCWTHDVQDDKLATFNDMKEVCGIEVARLSYALANDKGTTRKERAGDNYYEGIRNTDLGIFCKLCDRIANMRYGQMMAWTGNSKFGMYQKENAHFREQLMDERYQEMFDCIEEMLINNK